jgi:hypothetical protein
MYEIAISISHQSGLTIGKIPIMFIADLMTKIEPKNTLNQSIFRSVIQYKPIISVFKYAMAIRFGWLIGNNRVA